MTALHDCSQWHAEQARICASKASKLRGQVHRMGVSFNSELIHADALELMAAKHRLWARSCAEADTDESPTVEYPRDEITQPWRMH